MRAAAHRSATGIIAPADAALSVRGWREGLRLPGEPRACRYDDIARAVDIGAPFEIDICVTYSPSASQRIQGESGDIRFYSIIESRIAGYPAARSIGITRPARAQAYAERAAIREPSVGRRIEIERFAQSEDVCAPSRLSSARAGCIKRGQNDAREKGDYGDDDKKLDQGKAFAGRHGRDYTTKPQA